MRGFLYVLSDCMNCHFFRVLENFSQPFYRDWWYRIIKKNVFFPIHTADSTAIKWLVINIRFFAYTIYYDGKHGNMME